MKNNIPRFALPVIQNRLETIPVVALLGPRQCGKTTLARLVVTTCADALYLDLENPNDLIKLTDPMAFFMANRDKFIVLDEIQLWPELFGPLRSFIDSVERECRFLILGSASRELISQGSESLAGRITFLELTPFLYNEVSDIPINMLWERGGFPLSFLADDEKKSMRWREDYLRALVERDLPLLGLHVPHLQVHRLLSMLAHTHGELHNSQKLAESLGITGKTINAHIEYLEGAFLVRRILPYELNLKKRLVKSSKFYYRDSGLLHAMLKINDFNALLGHPIYGSSWEGFVIEQILGTIGDRWNSYFYRTQVGAELDMVLELGTTRIGIECKASAAPTVSRGFWNCIEDLSIKPENAWIVCPIDEQYPYKNGTQVGGIRQISNYLLSIG